MAVHSRRSFLRGTIVGLGALGAGCSTVPETGDPADRTSTRTPPDQSTWPPDEDERVDTTPPGAPVLDSGGKWPFYRFDAGNTGSNPDGTGVRNGTQYWRLNAGGPATVADGTLYNVFSRGQDYRTLTYRDPSTAAIQTRSQLVQYGVNAPPVVTDGRVFVTTFIEAFCFDAKSGKQQWRGPEMDGIQGCPAVHDETVLVNSGGFKDVRPHLRAFDAASGEESWQYDTGHESKSTPAVGDGRVFVVSTAGLHAIELASGEEAFVVEDVANRWATPVVHRGTVYAIGSGEMHDELVAADTGDGTVRWRTPVETDDPPVVTDGVVYTLTGDGVAALDSVDGSVISSNSKHVRPMGLVDDVLYAAGDGTAFALDVANDLEQLWSLTTESVQVSDTVGRTVYHITPVDGAVYVSARDAFHGVGPK